MGILAKGLAGIDKGDLTHQKAPGRLVGACFC